MEEAAGFHPLTHLSHRAGEGCQVSGGVLISRVPGSLRFSAQSPQAASIAARAQGSVDLPRVTRVVICIA